MKGGKEEIKETWARFIRPAEHLWVLRARRPDVVKICHAQDDFALWAETAELWLFVELTLRAPVVALKCEVYRFTPRVNAGPLSQRPYGAKALPVRLMLGRGEISIGGTRFRVVARGRGDRPMQ